jgi:hypothetical protein
MAAIRQGGFVRLRAASALLALLLGWLSAPASLAISSPDACSMACCVEKGHCCCTPRHASVIGQAPDANPALSQVEIVSPCPDGCANSTVSFNLSGREMTRPAACLLDLSGLVLFGYGLGISTHLLIRLSSASPRAPPSGNTLLA